MNVAINFQFLFFGEELMNRSRSKWRKYQEGRIQVQKCPVGEGREEGVGVEFSLCWTAAVTSKLRNSQPPSWKVEKSYLSLCFLEQCTFCFTSRGFIFDWNKYLTLGSPQRLFTWTTPMVFRALLYLPFSSRLCFGRIFSLLMVRSPFVEFVRFTFTLVHLVWYLWRVSI